jgi:hypothetical protein
MHVDYQHIPIKEIFKDKIPLIIYINIGIVKPYRNLQEKLHNAGKTGILCINYHSNTCNYDIYSYLCIKNNHNEEKYSHLQYII